MLPALVLAPRLTVQPNFKNHFHCSRVPPNFRSSFENLFLSRVQGRARYQARTFFSSSTEAFDGDASSYIGSHRHPQGDMKSLAFKILPPRSIDATRRRPHRDYYCAILSRGMVDGSTYLSCFHFSHNFPTFLDISIVLNIIGRKCVSSNRVSSICMSEKCV